MQRRSWSVLCLTLALAVAPAGPVPGGDRLERYRVLATSQLGLAELGPEGRMDSGRGELWALVDEEVVESLAAGGPFASTPFIQERLDGFAAAWGGARFRITALAPGPGLDPILVGLFTLTGPVPDSSVRVYGHGPDGPALLRTITHDGTGGIHAWPRARDGSAQVLLTWLGGDSGRGSYALLAELWRARAGSDLERVWTTSALFPDGLWVSRWSVGAGELRVRYELHYSGWTPGCADQTEQEDVYQLAAAGVRLAQRHVVNAWHRDLGGEVARFFEALRTGDGKSLSELVPDAALRARLPATLLPEPACAAPAGPAGAVAVAATEERPGGRTPWSLRWTPGAPGWRLTAAGPVLQ